MKKITCALAAITSSALLFSCNDKLNIAAPYKNITVVYALLNQADTAHYIRIQKAFMDENQSGIDMAKEADSSFYRDLTVSIKEINKAGQVLTTIPLGKVDLGLEGYPKEPGAFFNTPNYAYKFKHSLNSDYNYRLVIKNNTTGNIDSAVTSIINAKDSNNFRVSEWRSGSSQRIAFPKTMSPDGKLFETNYGVNIPNNVGAAQLILRFRWIDSNIAAGTGTYKSADFVNFSQLKQITPDTVKNQSFSVFTQNRNLYDFIRSSLGANPGANQYRYMLSCDMILYAAGIEYKIYNDFNSYKGGLTADEIRPVYTNIKGTDVRGLFSTRTFVQKLSIPFSDDTKDSIQNYNPATKDLHIRFTP
ncbi:MAG: hypothetical protein WC716_14510 [Chitinophagaceae bacterium]|jgi:hypothetical protein